MWYNEQLNSRGEAILNTYPTGRDLNAANANESPIDGWEWHTTPPQWYIDTHPEEFPTPP
jgi:hypothetical protein